MSKLPLNLALQGGGAHGAFTWGVLDRLLEDGRFDFEGLSGSSAGALNAVLFAEGWRKGGRDGARAALDAFWADLGRQLPFEWLTTGEGETIALSPASRLMMRWASRFSPGQMNPGGHNPLRDLLLTHIDFQALREGSPFRLFIGATEANTGKLRLFRETELSADVLLATSCLPQLHHAVTIDDETYWDGGYSANPAIYPLVWDCQTPDVMLVLLSPLRHESAPRTATEIEQRAMELSFSAHLMREMRMFAHGIASAGASWLPLGRHDRRLRKLRFHMIHSQGVPSMQRTETKMIAHTPYLRFLHEAGRQRASRWIDGYGGSIGRYSSVDLEEWFG